MVQNGKGWKEGKGQIYTNVQIVERSAQQGCCEERRSKDGKE
jgi:hypothetical protein